MKTRKEELEWKKRFLKSVAIFAVAIFWILNSSKKIEAATVETISASSYKDSPNYLNTYDMVQYHYVTTEKYVWVKGYMDGQATRGTKLNKGDGMSYTYSGRKAGSVSVSCGVSYAGVGASVSINLPTPKSVSRGTVSSVTRVAPSSGTYKLYGKLKYKITTKATYQRSIKLKYNSKTKKHYYAYGKWKYCCSRGKSYELISDESFLALQKK